MKFELNGVELDILLISLIGRRNSIRGLLSTDGMSDNYYDGYRQEMMEVDNLLEKFFPGSVKRIKESMAA